MPLAKTPISNYRLNIVPEPRDMCWYHDAQGNILAMVVLPEKITNFIITVEMLADFQPLDPLGFIVDPNVESWPFKYDSDTEQHLTPYRTVEPPGALLAALIADIPQSMEYSVVKLMEVTRRIQERISYAVLEEPSVLDPEQTLRSGRGSDRDSAWLLTVLLRHLGFAARFVSGYWVRLGKRTPPSERLADVIEEDGLFFHAWTQAYLPGAGWIGLDSTSGLVTNTSYIPLAAGADPRSVAPVSGMVEPTNVVIRVSMSAALETDEPVDAPGAEERREFEDRIRSLNEEVIKLKGDIGNGRRERDSRRFFAVKSAFAKKYHPNNLTSTGIESTIRGEIFKEFWHEIEAIEKED